MPTIRPCAECGTPLPEGVPDDACPICALRGALALSEASSQAAVTEQPDDCIGRYKLLEKIGEGGCGVVYLAEQAEPIRRHVALKVVKLGMDTRQVIARFEAERQALALMDHPNIAKVLDAGATDTGRPYFVMELVRGIKITDYCDQNNLPTRERLDLFIQVCLAVQHAHQKGIIHRDIKPSNILVTEQDGKPVPKVIDFGIAKATAGQALTDKTIFTGFAQFIGTPAYMSPEQAGLSGADIDTRSDIYSLGVLLYELLTGQLPFERKDLLQAGLDEMRRLIRQQEPPRPSTRLSALAKKDLTTVAKCRRIEPPKLIHLIRGDLDWIVMKCLEKDRTRRYETASGLTGDLERHLGNETVVARPPSNIYRLQKVFRRNKLVFVAGSAVIAALVLGVGFATWSYIRESRQRQEAEAARQREVKTRQRAEAAEKDQARLRQEAEISQKKAEKNAIQVGLALSISDFLQAVRLIAEDRDRDAVAYLVRSLRANPGNEAAIARLVTLLSCRSWFLPVMTLQCWPVASAQFSMNGKRILTVETNCAQVWDAQTGQRLIPPIMHDAGWLRFAEFSPDGSRIVTVSQSTARVWDAQTGQAVTGDVGLDGGGDFARFSPDSQRIVATAWDRFHHTARVWDAQTGQPLTEHLKHEMQVRLAQFSPDGKRVLTVSDDGHARVWDTQTSQPVTEPPVYTFGILSAQFDSEGKHIVTVSPDDAVRVWDARTGQALTNSLLRFGKVQSAHFSSDSRRIVTTSSDDTVRMWDARTVQPLTNFLVRLSTPKSALFSPDGRCIVTTSQDDTVRLWDPETGQPLTEPLRPGDKIQSAQLSPNGKHLVTVSGGWVRVWGLPTGQPLTEPVKHSHNLRALSSTPIDVALQYILQSQAAHFSPDGKRMVTPSHNTARVWNVESGELLTEPLKHTNAVSEKRMTYGGSWNANTVSSAQFSPDGKHIATASWDHTARVWDAQTGQPLGEPLRHEGAVVSAQFSPDGQRVVTASLDKTARVWNARTSQPLTVPLKHENSVVSAQFSPDGRRILTTSGSFELSQISSDSPGYTQIWDSQTGQRLTEPLKHDHSVLSAQFSPDGKHILTASMDKTARVWDAQTGEPLTEPLQHDDVVVSAQFSRDGKRVVTASLDKTARVWDAQTGQPVTAPLKHGGSVISAQFSPDGQRVVTASEDQTARVWDAQTGQPLAEPLQHDSSVIFAQFSPKGRRILTLSVFGYAWMWDLGPLPRNYPDWLPQLAETLAGEGLNDQGGLESVKIDRAEVLGQIRHRLNQEPDTNDWTRWGRWLLADASTRSISPCSKIAVPEWIENRVKQNTVYSLTEAERVVIRIGDAGLLGRISQALAQARTRDEQATAQTTKYLAAFQEAYACRERGRFLAQNGRWKEAAAEVAKALQLAPNDWAELEQLLPILVQAGDMAGYRQHRSEMLSQFGTLTNLIIEPASTAGPGGGWRRTGASLVISSGAAEDMAAVCLLLPAEGTNLAMASRLAGLPATPSANVCSYAKGLAEYRQGHFASAVEWTKRAPTEGLGGGYDRVPACAVLAMALHQLNQREESNAALAKGKEMADKELPKLDSSQWSAVLVPHILLREATALIEEVPAGTDQSEQPKAVTAPKEEAK